jgi:hypothetical protein
MPRQHDGMIIVGQHIFNLFLERPPCDLHRLSGEFIQPVSADIPSRDPAPTFVGADEVQEVFYLRDQNRALIKLVAEFEGGELPAAETSGGN